MGDVLESSSHVLSAVDLFNIVLANLADTLTCLNLRDWRNLGAFCSKALSAIPLDFVILTNSRSMVFNTCTNMDEELARTLQPQARAHQPSACVYLGCTNMRLGQLEVAG